MFNPASLIRRYTHWLHTKWPAGTVEKLPEVNADGSTNVPGLYVVGDLAGVPLLKFSADSGARAVQRIAHDLQATRQRANGKAADEVLDVVIIGAGTAGMAAALEARKAGLRFEIIEASEPFSTIINFPKRKPIYTYPTEMTPAGDLRFTADVKESLLDELREQTSGIQARITHVDRITRRAGLLQVNLTPDSQSQIRNPKSEILPTRSVIVAIGRSGNYRKLDVSGEALDKVHNRLHDPKDYAGMDVLVVGGGDSALETAIAISKAGGRVTLSYRKADLSRAKPENIDRIQTLSSDPSAAGSLRVMLGSEVQSITETNVSLINASGDAVTLPNDVVFTMIGREPPLDFFRRSGVRINGEWNVRRWVTLFLFLAFCVFLYHWKSGGSEWPLSAYFKQHKLFPFNIDALFTSLGTGVRDLSFRPTHLLFTLKESMRDPGFYYTLAYSLCVTIFGVRRIRRRRTPYVKWQTITLILIQVIPLFLLPQILLPWMGRNGWFNTGPQAWVADQLFESYQTKAYGYDWSTNANIEALGDERAWWRTYGLVLAWPLFIYNVFTDQPMWAWLVISFLQTFVAIPLMIYFWGKGAYCGWICSCGALAETLGDAHRHKMPHGPFWNRLNMLGQVILAVALLLLVLRIAGWIFPDANFTKSYTTILSGVPFLNYKWFVDLLLAGILGVGLYFHFSGRVWCRFACPLAALMNVYHRFSRFRILADKKRCISCNVCTSVCHQGIDVMNFANKGQPMADPQCVRCSACVQMCPTGVLSFGQVDPKTQLPIKRDPPWLEASPVLMREIKVNGRTMSV